MEIKELTDEQKSLLKSPLPKEAVKVHPTKTYLSSIKAIYVTERLNDVFGVGVWQIKTNFQADGGKGMIVVKTILEIPTYGMYYESFGGNDNGGEGNKNFDLGDAYKGATTDAITKICSYMGIGADVFKGKQTGGDNKTQAQEQQKWFNNPELKVFIEGNKVNNFTTAQEAIKKIRETYSISGKMESSIKDLFTDAGKPEK